MKSQKKNTSIKIEEIKDEQLDNVQGGSRKAVMATTDRAKKGKQLDKRLSKKQGDIMAEAGDGSI